MATEEKAAASGGSRWRGPLVRDNRLDPMIMGMGPVEALKRAATPCGALALDDLDLFELNEAFDSQSLAVFS